MGTRERTTTDTQAALLIWLRDPNIKNHYSKNNYKKMRQMSEQARDKNA